MDITVKCKKKGCTNQGVDVPVDVSASYVVVCGPCGTLLAEHIEPDEPSGEVS
jgi:ribosomal protein S27E